MPKPQQLVNGFIAREVASISGLSLHMINCLAREGYISPAYMIKGARGRVRHFSYRDLVIGRLIRNLLDAGVEIERLKRALGRRASSDWAGLERTRALNFIATDGKKLFFPDPDGSLTEISQGSQRAFAFILDVGRAKMKVKSKLKGDRLAFFSMQNLPLKPVLKEEIAQQSKRI